MAERFDVFLSYSRRDADEWSRVLAENLARLGVWVWWDGWEVRPGDVLVHELDRGLQDSLNGILVVSPTTLESVWVQQEYAALMQRAIEGRRRIVPVLYADADLSPLLASRVRVDFPAAPGNYVNDATIKLEFTRSTAQLRGAESPSTAQLRGAESPPSAVSSFSAFSGDVSLKYLGCRERVLSARRNAPSPLMHIPRGPFFMPCGFPLASLQIAEVLDQQGRATSAPPCTHNNREPFPQSSGVSHRPGNSRGLLSGGHPRPRSFNRGLLPRHLNGIHRSAECFKAQSKRYLDLRRRSHFARPEFA